MALSAARTTPVITGYNDPNNTGQANIVRLPVKASVTVYAGAFVVLSAGYAAPATTATAYASPADRASFL